MPAFDELDTGGPIAGGPIEGGPIAGGPSPPPGRDGGAGKVEG